MLLLVNAVNYQGLFIVLELLRHFETVVIHTSVWLEHLEDCILVEVVNLIIDKLEEFELHFGYTVKQNSVFLQAKLVLRILEHVELDL